MTRRTFLGGTAVAVATLAAAQDSTAPRPGAGEGSGPSRRAKVIDCHGHFYHHSRPSWAADDRRLIDAADKLGIDQLCCSIITPVRPSTVQGFRECNQWMWEGMKRFPDRVLGYCYVNPTYGKEALEEVRRCVGDRGFIGVKLYNENVCTTPVVFPVIELAIELGVPILHHAGHSHYFITDQPHISDGAHLAELSRRYPEARLICAHICGGGDWEWTIKALRHAPGVFLDTSGSVADEGTVEMAARVVGPDRLLFGCDMSMTASVGRIRAAAFSAGDRAKVLGGNMEKLLRRRAS